MGKHVYLCRKEWVSTCYMYEMLVTPQLAEEYSKYINENYTFKDVESIELTEQDLINAWDRSWDEASVLNTIVTAHLDYKYNYALELGDVVADLLNDDMWEQDYDQGDTHTEDVEDYIYTVPTKEEN